MKSTSPVATEVGSLFEDMAEVAHRVRARAERDLEFAEFDEGVGGGSPEREVRQAVRAARGQALLEGARGLEKLAADAGANLTPAESFGLEAIVLLVARPALLVQAGGFASLASLPQEWSMLDAHRTKIQESIRRVGRIELTGHPDLEWAGTGFLVAPDVVMTNRHVAIEFARRGDSGCSFLSGRSCGLDLLREAGNPAEMRFTVTEVLGIHDDDYVDMALLRVSPAGEGGSTPLPPPLELMATSPDEAIGRPVYVVGYPAWDGRRNEPAAMSRIFTDVYNVKRLQPGVTTRTPKPETAFGHDCSTLGGNSGSPVIDLTTHHVMGLHFGGRYGRGNYALPMWQLVDDPMVCAAGLNYVG